jgi:flagellar biosynthesis component FlhA
MDLIEKKEVDELLHRLLKEYGKIESDEEYLVIDRLQDLVKNLPIYSVSGLFNQKQICDTVQRYAEGAPSTDMIMDKLNNR